MLQSMGSQRVGHDWATEQEVHCLSFGVQCNDLLHVLIVK